MGAFRPFDPPLISYAQNCEDVVLWRALGDVKRGFYVDVGAADPDVDSVTRAFYERGWTGVNIEPTEAYFTRLQECRPRDRNLKLLAGARGNIATLHVVPGTGLSTVDVCFAAEHARQGFETAPTSVPVLPLDTILAEHEGPIHFLKIDVEGAERAVLEGLDLQVIRPWIILVEATVPNSTERTQHLWEDLLLQRGYLFCMFEGLNAYYVAQEHVDRRDLVSVPAGVHDNYRTAADQGLRDMLAGLQNELGRLREVERSHGELTAVLPDLRAAQEELARRHTELAAIGDPAQLRCMLDELAQAQEEAAARTAELGRTRAELLRRRQDLAARDQSLEATREELAATTRDLADALKERLHLRQSVGAAEQRAEELRARLAVTLASDSWWVTAPMCAVSRLLRRVLRGERHTIPVIDRSPLRVENVSLLRVENLPPERVLAAAERRVEELRARLVVTLASDSWRITAPMRAVNRLLRRVLRGERRTIPPIDLSPLRAENLPPEAALAAAEQRAEELRARLAAMLASDSWRVTAPMRAVSRVLRGERRTIPPIDLLPLRVENLPPETALAAAVPAHASAVRARLRALRGGRL